MNKLEYRRQFLLVNKSIPELDTWKKDVVATKNLKMDLYCHPDLPCIRERNSDFELLMLGYILDPENPSYTDEEILKDLIKFRTLDEFTRGIEKYNGRYVFIFIAGERIIVLNDAVAFREVYYAFLGETIAIGSTPAVIADFTGIPRTVDPEILAFHKSKARIEAEEMWIGTRTLYDGVLQLLPNHYLDIPGRESVRFWPNQRIEKMGLDECAAECASIMKGTLESAVNRYKLHMGITAGWDTRLLLSTAKEYKDRIFFYVNKPESYDSDHKDIKIPKQLARNLGFKLNVVDISDKYDKEFAKIFFKNNPLARDRFIHVFYDVHKRGWQDFVTVSGTMGNGLARIYTRMPKGEEINGFNVAKFAHFEHQKFAVEELEDWCRGIRDSLEEWNVDVMDLFQQEQENAHWASLSSSEQDIVREEIRPFNNRKLIRLFWSLEDKHRYQYYAPIYIKMMDLLWKEVMDYPINPSRRASLYRVLRVFGIERQVYNYYKKRQYLKAGK